MQKLSKLESFKIFQIGKKSMDLVSGSRTKEFGYSNGACAKIIDNNDGSDRVIKHKPRFSGKCYPN